MDKKILETIDRFNEEEENEILREAGLVDDTVKNAKDIYKKGKKELEKIKKFIRQLYTSNEKQLIENRPSLSKTIARAIIIIGVFKLPVVGPIASVCAYFTDRYISMEVSNEQKKKLYNTYIVKIRNLDKKIENEENELAKKKYEALRKELKKNAEKLNLYL